MNQKDQYTVVRNPNNFAFPFEVWCKGSRKVAYMGEDYKDVEVVKRISSYRTEAKAKDVVKYWESLQEFRGGVNVGHD